MNRATACIILLIIFIVALSFTIGLAIVFTDHATPLMSIPFVVLSIIPTVLYGICIAIGVRLVRE